ncbi:hypothetical protein B4U79_11016, partial [Dinothrombium tinctorium]
KLVKSKSCAAKKMATLTKTKVIDNIFNKRKYSPQKTTLLSPNKKHVRNGFIDEKSDQCCSQRQDAPNAPQMFVDKYKPTNLKQVIGQQGDRSNAKKLMQWLQNWHTNINKKPTFHRASNDDPCGFRAALLSGPPGVGKTTTAQIVCKELGYDYVELNASDTRNKKSLEEYVASLLENKVLNNFFTLSNGKVCSDGSKHVLIMDEVDGMSGNEDRGGMQELIQLIKKTRIPIICICNDRSHPKVRSLVNYCYDLRFYKPTVEQIKAAMLSICFKEGIKISPQVLHELILASNQDIRQVMHYLSLFGAKDERIEKITAPSIKDVKLGPFDAVKKVFTSGHESQNASSFREKSDLFFMDYSLMPLFCFENYLKAIPLKAKGNESERLKRVAESANAMAFGDIIEREIRQSQSWSLLPLQAVFSTVMPGFYMNGSMPPLSQFPAFLGKISAINRKDRLLQELNMHMSLTISGDKTGLNLDYLEPLRLAITQPLIDRGNSAIPEVLNILHGYNLRKDDIDTIIELSLWSHEKDPMSSIDSKTKASLTRAYNKDGELLPYSSVDEKAKKRKRTAEVNDIYYGENEDGLPNDNGDEVNSEESEDDDFIAPKKVSRKEAKSNCNEEKNETKTSGKNVPKKTTKKVAGNAAKQRK